MTVYVVTGPPAAGKTTWVRQHAKLGDIVIDYDALVEAISPGSPSDPDEQPDHVAAVALAARSAAIDEALSCDGGADVYLVHAMPARHAINRYRNHGCRILTIDPGYTECMRRAARERSERQQGIVHDWYDRRGLVQ